MNASTTLRKTLAVLAAGALVFTLYFAIERPWFLHWGASRSEIAAPRPGHARVPLAADPTVRAVTIQAPVRDVWPWLAQIGQDRGGFYSYEVLEDLVGCEMPRARQIHPEQQSWKAGDALWMYPPSKLHGMGGAALVSCDPGHHLVFATRQIGTPPAEPADGLWGFSLEPIDAGSSRLIAWGRAPGEKHFLPAAFSRLFFEPAHYVMERRMLLNLKGLAEGRLPSKSMENAAVALWTWTVLLLLVALVEVARRPRWQEPLAIVVLAALLFQTLTLLQPPLLPSLLLVLVLTLALARGLGRRPTGAVPSRWPRAAAALSMR